jgi:hypothetical protein
VDWYSFYKPYDNSYVSINLYPPASSDYDMELWQQGAGIRSASTQTGNGVTEQITWTYSSGTFYIKVFGKNGAYNTGSSYTLTASY